MITTVAPGMVRTATGVPLPLVSLPQDDLLTVNIDQIPLLKDAMGPGIHIQPLRLDPEKGQVVLMATMAPGCVLPIHYHTGTAEVYTFSGCWKYREYPDQPQTAGSYLYEPGGSMHTFYCPEDNTEDTVVLLWMEGAQIGFNDDGLAALHQRRRLHSARDRDGVRSAGNRTGGLHPRRLRRRQFLIRERTQSWHRHLTAFGSSSWARSTTARTAGSCSPNWAPTSSRSSHPAVSSCAFGPTRRSNLTNS